MAKRKKKPVPLPRMTFSKSGPKLTTKELSEFTDLLYLPDEYRRFLNWRNGGTPALQYFQRTDESKALQTSRIDRFFGLDSSGFKSPTSDDIIWWILRLRHLFPKSAIPLAVVDDESYLLTFPSYDERADQVWFKYSFEISQWADGADEESCYFVADSVPHLISMLHAAPEDEESL
jgi:hypothetical protein